jgi:hypothetical protein
MNIESLVTNTTPVNGEWQGETFVMQVFDNALTPSVLQAFKDIEDRPMEMARGLSEILASWDITMGESEFPPTATNLAKLPVDFLTYLMNKIGEGWSGKKPTSTPSRNGSAPAEK